MQVPEDSTAVGDSVLAALEGKTCSYCNTGTLARGEYKGNAAVVCDDCRTPTAQLW